MDDGSLIAEEDLGSTRMSAREVRGVDRLLKDDLLRGMREALCR
jgi:hypothetical protein